MHTCQETIELIEKIAKRINSLKGRAFYVGGKVRDEVLDYVSKDFDIEVYGLTEYELEDVLSEFGQVIKKGISFGVFSVKGYEIDFALPRLENKIGEKHTDFKVEVNPNLSYTEALRRRDITINAMLEDVLTKEIIDPFMGMNDIKNKVIHHIDENTFVEDALRVFRVAQFAARLEFQVDLNTIELCKGMNTSYLSKERIYEETNKALLQANKPSIYFKVLKKMNQLSVWFKELNDLIDIQQSPEHHPEGDVFTHVMMVIDEAAKYRTIVKYPLYFMYSAVCHDVGKAFCTKEIDGKITAINHDIEGVYYAKQMMNRLTNHKFANQYIMNMVKNHMRPNWLAKDNASLQATRKLYHESLFPLDLIYLCKADRMGRGKETDFSTYEEYLLQRLEDYNHCLNLFMIKGEDVLKLGYQGSVMKDILNRALELHFKDISKVDILKKIQREFPRK